MSGMTKSESWRDVFRHWLKFNVVGALGIGVQLAILVLLRSGLGVNYLVATFFAVEATILHNFVWHERWTWRDKTRESPGRLLVRLFRFNFSTGAASLFGNLILMRILVGSFHLNYFVANLLSIGGCASLNFAASHWFVFRTKSA